jgi:hypothetical protein
MAQIIRALNLVVDVANDYPRVLAVFEGVVSILFGPGVRRAN